jgi:large subunit ribosomal protein L18
MKSNSNKHKVAFRRKRQGKTNYKKRLSLLKSGKARFVIRPSLIQFHCQLISYKMHGDIVISSAKGKDLEKFGWKYDPSNISSAYLTGYLAGKKAKGKVSEAILDSGLLSLTKGSKVYACIKGLFDSGIKIAFKEDIIPDDERISGKHISEYAKLLKEKDKASYEKQFSSYIKKNLDPEKITKDFQETKKKLEAE